MGYILLFFGSRQSSAYRRKYNPKKNPRPSKSKNKKIREKIKSVASALSVNLIERVRTEPKAKEHNNVVLSSRQPISTCFKLVVGWV